MPHPRSAPLVIPPQQQRSRETLHRLLDAAEEVFAAHGIDGATVPRIAERAGMSVGIVYRRFRDKDALLRATYERFFERILAANREALAPENWRDESARQIIEAVVTGMVIGHATHRKLLHALLLYADAHGDADFRRRVAELNSAAVDQVVALLKLRRAEIAHADVASAVRLALLVVASTLGRWVHPDSESVFSFPDATQLARELTAMVVGYLGVES